VSCCFAFAVLPAWSSRGSLYPLPFGTRLKVVKRFYELNFQVIAAGDSYNETTMLSETDKGTRYRPRQNVIDEFPQFPVATDYGSLRRRGPSCGGEGGFPEWVARQSWSCQSFRVSLVTARVAPPKYFSQLWGDDIFAQ
jgi:hypothetical protein